jgi:hypothetical protein
MSALSILVMILVFFRIDGRIVMVRRATTSQALVA